MLHRCVGYPRLMVPVVPEASYFKMFVGMDANEETGVQKKIELALKRI